MPKKNPGMTPQEQSEAFKKKVLDLIDAGELNPTDADAAFERLMDTQKNGRRRRQGDDAAVTVQEEDIFP